MGSLLIGRNACSPVCALFDFVNIQMLCQKFTVGETRLQYLFKFNML